ncbi:uncharacterized protein PV06_00284 [Exophiala oligosperma]|uniref:Inositol polyphosphate-related phosphatase domain-containing protein n=1 Tax=Exophiala oligosperma TaxID=215243 RepID=A0A0D2B5R6_9EURO|nr:uncharacterized protein PV06_00284 [Exophiala oligosperma]KIW47601.1 hypothetical protein PV06_00284 [Exophiala oligosperma]
MSLKPDKSDGSRLSPEPWKSSDPWGLKPSQHGAPPGAYPSSPNAQDARFIAPQSLSAAVRARKSDYVRKRSMKIKIGSWNVASISGTEKDLGAWFIGGNGVRGLSQNLSGANLDDDDDGDSDSDEHIESIESQEARTRNEKKKTTVPKHDVPGEPNGEDIDLYVLGLQEVIDVSSMTEAIRPYTDPNPGKKWKRALKRALPRGYKKVAEEQLLGLLLLIYASPEVAPSISSVSTTSVGTGLMGYLGNKGAVSARLMLAESTRLCFVNCHLAAGADLTALNRRIWDTTQILNRTRFAPVSTDGEGTFGGEEKIGDEDLGFWFGDLNYRLDDIPGEDVRRLLLLHTRNEYDVENKSKRRIDSELGYVSPPPGDSSKQENTHYEISDVERPATASDAEPPLDPKSDPASLHVTLQSLLAHDQLKHQQKLRKAFHEGWREGEINFLPTYKYDVGSVGMFDSGEKKRSPSWCDRILYRTRHDIELYEEKAKQLEEARKKDESMKARGIDQASAEQDVLFDYDPDADGMAYGDDYDEYDERDDARNDAELVRTHEDYGDMIELNNYISHQRVLSSDHKPLDAVFTVTYDAVIPELKAKVHHEVAREFDKAENEGRPALTVVVDHHSDEQNSNADGSADMNAVSFGDVRYALRKTRAITVANTGQITASFSFVERPAGPENEASIAPPWLEVRADPEIMQQPVKGRHDPRGPMSLLPGETTTVELIVDITEGELVKALNWGEEELDDILVLRIENGRDHFVPVKGTWLPSAYFRYLGELVQAPEGGARKLQLRTYSGHNDQAFAGQHSAPKELYVLTEIIPVYVERSVAEWGMLHDRDTPPWQYENVGIYWPFYKETWTFHEGDERSDMLASVREALDTASPLEASLHADVPCIVRLEVLVEVLVSFLQSLQDGIIPAEVWSEVERRLSSMEKAKVQPQPEGLQDMIMDPLSHHPIHSVSFTFITFLLTRLINELVPCGIPISGPITHSTSPDPSRRSRASTMSSESGKEPSIYSEEALPGKKGLFSALRRRRTQSISSVSATGTEQDAADPERRSKLVDSIVEIFAPIVIRSENDDKLKGKDKKVLDARKKRVLESFLDMRQP